MTRRWIAFALALPLAFAACGQDAPAPQNASEAAPGEAAGTDAEVAADAALADHAAQAEAEDAAIGGNVTQDDVSAAGNVVSNAQ